MMTRTQSKSQWFKHEGLYDAERATGLPLRLAFIGLLGQCDREGRFRWRPRTLKSDVLPFDEVNFVDVLDTFCALDLVDVEEADGEIYGRISATAGL